MSRSVTRTVSTYYTACYDERGDDVERNIAVTVSPDGLRDVRIETDLSDVPESELARLEERVAELYWAAEHRDYLRSAEAERDGA